MFRPSTVRLMSRPTRIEPESEHFNFLNPIFQFFSNLIVTRNPYISNTVNASTFLLASIFLRHASAEASTRIIGDTEYPGWVDGRGYILGDCVDGIKEAVKKLDGYVNKEEIRGVVTNTLYKELPDEREAKLGIVEGEEEEEDLNVTITDVEVVLGLYRGEGLEPSDCKLFHLVHPKNRLYIPQEAYTASPTGGFSIPTEYEGNYLKSMVRLEALWWSEGKEEGEGEGEKYGKLALEGVIEFREKAIEWKVCDEVRMENEEEGWTLGGGHYE